MPIPQSLGAPWTRKHDKPGSALIPNAPVIYYPQSLEDLVTICSAPNRKVRAAGSHWALNQSAVSDDVFVETNHFFNIFPAMGRTLYEVVPACLSDEFVKGLVTRIDALSVSPQSYYVHVEAGKRIYQAYAEMDLGDDNHPNSLAVKMLTEFDDGSYLGPWGFPTLGGAGGQTVVGALTTGTHGGDVDRPPIADAVVALHLVTDGGKHYWIEQAPVLGVHITDKAKIDALYGDIKFGGPDNFAVIYPDDVLNAARVQVGRFGIIYSVVLKVERQYGLFQSIDNYLTGLDTWESVKGNISDRGSPLFLSKGPDGTTP